MQIGSIEIEFVPGSTYSEFAEPGNRDEARREAVDQMKKAVQRTTLGQLDQATAAVLALAIQLRSVGGSAAGTNLPKIMKEAQDFLEEL